MCVRRGSEARARLPLISLPSPPSQTTIMAALRHRAASLAVLSLLCVVLELCLAERYGLPARSIGVARSKRSGPAVVDVGQSDVASPVMDADPEPIPGHSEHTSRRRRSVNDTTHTPDKTVVCQ